MIPSESIVLLVNVILRSDGIFFRSDKEKLTKVPAIVPPNTIIIDCKLKNIIKLPPKKIAPTTNTNPVITPITVLKFIYFTPHPTLNH